jgi:cell wall assembly regulator SMI1
VDKLIPPVSEYTALLARLETWLAKHRPGYLRALLPGAAAAELDAAQAAIGMNLPPGLRVLLTWHNGQSPETPASFEESWKLLTAREISAEKKELDGDPAAAARQSAWRRTWIPFMEDDSGSYLVLDASLPEPAVRVFVPGEKNNPVVAASLLKWLDAFVGAVERGEYTEDPERGDFVRVKPGK